MSLAALLVTSLAVSGLAVIVERIVGWPAFLQRAIGHPVAWIGALVSRLDSALNRETIAPALRRLSGVAALLLLLAVVALVTVPLTLWLRSIPWGWAVEAVLCVPLLSQRDLARFVRAVETGLKASLTEGRDAVRHIIGRDPETLDESGVACGAIESLAENTSDGVVAPVFWIALFGLPAGALYKAINTADSMLGYRSERHLHFGWASARLDDLVNLVPARLTAMLFALAAAFQAGASPRHALRCAWRDAPRHVSPNAGWPEAALAGALGLRLGGPRSYHGRVVDLAVMGDGRAELGPGDIARSLALYRRALAVLGLMAIVAIAYGGFA